MTDLAKLETALRNADAAGDTDAAKQLAGAIREAQQPKTASFGSTLMSAAIRPIAKAIASPPLMAMDLGVGMRNLIGGGNYELPSSMFNKALDQVTVAPSDWLGQGAEFASTALAGSALPSPQGLGTFKEGAKSILGGSAAPTGLAPANFVKPSADLIRQKTLQTAQQEGLTVPPSTTNPTIVNKALESLGGKIATAQDASLNNQPIFTSLARRTLNLPEDTPLTGEALKALRSQASAPNQAIRETGTIVTDPKFETDVAGILSKYKSAGGVSKELSKTEISDLANSFEKQFPASDAVDAIQVLRDKATAAYSKGESELGKGYRALSKALEDQVERHLEGMGQNGSDLLKAFREGRKLIAKSFSVESALNPATGNISATKLASQLSKGKPLSGELKTIAQFGQAFPKAAREILDSGSVRNTDVMMGAGTAVLSREPSWLLYPFARQLARKFLLSNAGQKLATPGSFQLPPGLLMGGATGEEQARQSIFGQ